MGPVLEAVMQNYGDFVDIILLHRLQCDYEHLHFVYSLFLQSVTVETDQTSGECSLGQTIPI